MFSVGNDAEAILPSVLEIISSTSKVNNLAPDQDFYEAGVTSVMALPILLEIEDRFQVSIPDDEFVVARTPQAVAQLIAGLRKA
jgi:acyl carrier protein